MEFTILFTVGCVFTLTIKVIQLPDVDRGWRHFDLRVISRHNGHEVVDMIQS